MPAYEVRHGDLLISDRADLLDVGFVHDFLAHRSYWARGVSRERVECALAHSLCFGAYRAGRPVGFARVITDRATFGWLADVFVLESERGAGIGKRLVGAVLGHPDLQGLRALRLVTSDAHGLYARHGFMPVAKPEHFMEFRPANPYNSVAPAARAVDGAEAPKNP